MYKIKSQMRFRGDGNYLNQCSADLTEIIMFSLHDMLYISHRVVLVQDIKDQLVEDHAGY